MPDHSQGSPPTHLVVVGKNIIICSTGFLNLRSSGVSFHEASPATLTLAVSGKTPETEMLQSFATLDSCALMRLKRTNYRIIFHRILLAALVTEPESHRYTDISNVHITQILKVTLIQKGAGVMLFL
jgi:hypothetical protein